MIDTAIVIAAGKATRWGDYLDTPKHLIEIDGESILNRTTRLLKKRAKQVWAVVPNDGRYRQHSANSLTVEPKDADADKFYSSRRLWNGNTAIVYGDCYLTDAAVEAIMAPVDDWVMYCRPGASDITGCPYGECFALSVPAHQLDWVADRVVWLAGMQALGETWRSGGWELYRALTGQPLDRHAMTTNYAVIDDWTEDFDHPADYEMWMHRRSLR